MLTITPWGQQLVLRDKEAEKGSASKQWWGGLEEKKNEKQDGKEYAFIFQGAPSKVEICQSLQKQNRDGLVRDLNPGPLAP